MTLIFLRTSGDKTIADHEEAKKSIHGFAKVISNENLTP